jgi:hypothetical protein
MTHIKIVSTLFLLLLTLSVHAPAQTPTTTPAPAQRTAERGRRPKAEADPAAAAQRLVDLAYAAGAPDNIACVVADVVSL